MFIFISFLLQICIFFFLRNFVYFVYFVYFTKELASAAKAGNLPCMEVILNVSPHLVNYIAEGRVWAPIHQVIFISFIAVVRVKVPCFKCIQVAATHQVLWTFCCSRLSVRIPPCLELFLKTNPYWSAAYWPRTWLLPWYLVHFNNSMSNHFYLKLSWTIVFKNVKFTFFISFEKEILNVIFKLSRRFSLKS